MVRIAICFAGAALCASAASAADHLEFAPAPSWVVPQEIPQKSTNAANAPAAILLNDSQVRLEPGKTTSYIELATKVQTADGLSAGNISLPWPPSTDTITVNKLHIIRDGKIIDVLKLGQTFTVLRRETNLEAATLDGTLTATIQPEGLQVGDIVDLAITDEHVDPVLKGHVEGTFGGWNGVPIELAHFRLSWPAKMQLRFQQSESLPKPQHSTAGEFAILEMSVRSVEPLILPKGAPLRFALGRFGEVTDFGSWSELSDLMRPLYRKAAIIPASGPLRDEVERIRKSAKTPKDKAEAALELVEQRVRYVALEMGTGGFVPADAETTWSRRFGDCKGKTALLLALLHELGIDAEPVLVHHRLGDILPERLPMVAYFDHVIVRAHVDGKDYWLDGTRTGDGDIDRIETPIFEWGLPLVADAKLVSIMPPPLDRPNDTTFVEIDASDGIFAPAGFTATRILRGDKALLQSLVYSKLTSAQRGRAMRDYWRNAYDYVTIGDVSSSYDSGQSEFRLSMTGRAQLPWKDGWWYVPNSTIAFDPDFSRAPGQFHDAPFATNFRSFESTHVTVRLPEGFPAPKLPPPVKETLAGDEYRRTAVFADNVLTVETSQRGVAPEVTYASAIAAEPRLEALYDDDIYLAIPREYRPTKSDVQAQIATKPASAGEFIQKGSVLASSGRYDEAIAAFTQALQMDPNNIDALGARAFAYSANQDSAAAKRDFAAIEKIKPGSERVARLRGMVQLMNDDPKAADNTFSELVAAHPGDADALVKRGAARAADGRPGDAVADFSAALRLSPNKPEALSGRAYTYHALGDDDKALADIEAASIGGVVPPQLRLLRANIFRGRGRHDLVVKEAALLVEENPKSDYALVAAGKIFSAEGQREKALDAFDRALDLHHYAYIYINRAQVRAPNDDAGRMADLRQALKLEPNQPEALGLMGWFLLREQKFAESIAAFDTALAKGPAKSLDLRRGRAIALFKSGKTSKAQTEIAAIGAESEEPAELNSLCWEMAKAGVMLETALANCHEAVRLRPDAAGYRDSLGMALLRLGKLEESIAAYSKAIEKAHFAPSYMGRAIAYARKGDMNHARADRAEALKRDADVEAQFANYGLAIDQSQNSRVSR